MSRRHQHIRAVTGITLDRTQLDGQAAIDRMADDFRVCQATAESVTEHDLERIGWTVAQITKFGRDASRLATQISMRQRAFSRMAG